MYTWCKKQEHFIKTLFQGRPIFFLYDLNVELMEKEIAKITFPHEPTGGISMFYVICHMKSRSEPTDLSFPIFQSNTTSEKKQNIKKTPHQQAISQEK